MSIQTIAGVACFYLACSLFASAQPLTCIKPGTDRWPIKITLPPGAKTQTMTIDQALALPRLTGVATNDAKFRDARITGQPQNEDVIVTLSGYLYLVGFESDDCDFHIQISPQPRTSTDKPTPEDNCIIVEAPSGQYAVSIKDQVEGVRQWIVDNLLKKTAPTIGSVHVMAHPVYVTVTGALFYDDAHEYLANGSTGRGKEHMDSKTLWELHPVTSIAFATPPKP